MWDRLLGIIRLKKEHRWAGSRMWIQDTGGYNYKIKQEVTKTKDPNHDTCSPQMIMRRNGRSIGLRCMHCKQCKSLKLCKMYADWRDLAHQILSGGSGAAQQAQVCEVGTTFIYLKNVHSSRADDDTETFSPAAASGLVFCKLFRSQCGQQWWHSSLQRSRMALISPDFLETRKYSPLGLFLCQYIIVLSERG